LLHTEHHFNGLLTNKIPLFKRFNWNLVAGTNSFYIDQNHNHFEYFVGLENILKILRIDWVSAYDDGGKRHSSGICIGLGGLLGNAMNNQNATGRTASEF